MRPEPGGAARRRRAARWRGLALGLWLASAAVAAAETRPATVVELFQSQGCSSCPPANANINALADRPDLLVLSFAVTYWDDLGWRDTFATPQFTARQRDYARGLGNRNVYTPQVVLNGRADLVGADRGKLERAIRTASKMSAGPELSLEGGTLRIGAGAAPAGGADIWLVRYDPRVQRVPIARGENRGKTLPHRNIVRELKRLGAWSGADARIAPPPSPDPAWRTAVMVQARNGGPILAALKF